jgi:hypothetical protein
MRSDGTLQPLVAIGLKLYYGTATTDWQYFDITVRTANSATTGPSIFLGSIDAAAGYVEFDDVSVKQIYSLYGDANEWNRYSFYSLVGEWANFNSVDPITTGGATALDDSGEYQDIVRHEQPVEQFVAGWDSNHNWYDDLSDASPAAGVFNENSPAYYSVIESFEIWDGANWADTPNLIGPYDVTPPDGWNGWYNDDTPSTDLPIEVESFEEAWSNDPFHTGYDWHSGSASLGYLQGDAITFPFVVSLHNSTLYLLHRIGAATSGTLYKLTLTAATYNTAALLATHLNTLMPAALTNAGFEWSSWTSGTTSGLTFGYDGSTDTSGTFNSVVFATPERQAYWKDARVDIGFNSFNPHNTFSEVYYPGTSLLAPLPSGILATDTIICDSYAEIQFATDSPYSGVLLYMYGQTNAEFDTTIAGDTNWELFLLTGWFGAGAAWKTAYIPADLSAATFVGPVTIEQFVNTDWPDELMP